MNKSLSLYHRSNRYYLKALQQTLERFLYYIIKKGKTNRNSLCSFTLQFSITLFFIFFTSPFFL
ncbi:hypothetical protein Lalb_Chr20g0110321 [Lupinus albus]|uniref:Uncharacterized protein n=1 Tax=Lupinus albus TaxID=3870 RepID=A0A6A4NTL3_LUPAL|nr:hypothetical protein Lalb_Chr20g0110321 [Lupinus albus]